MDTSDAIRVTYDDNGRTFEILVNPDDALAYKRGDSSKDFENILFVREIFKDVSTGERASQTDVEDVFNTDRIVEAAEEIFDNGRMELTTEQKNQLREEKRKRIINLIARQAMNPQTNTPHPPKRIENALEEITVTIDPLTPAEEQVGDIIEKLRPKLPISLEKKAVALRIPHKYAGKCQGIVQNMTEVQEEEWGNDAYMAKVKLPAGIQKELVNKLNEICSGDFELREL